MRYSDLQIETQRQAPARARSEGAAFLNRAGYKDHDGNLTALGKRLYARLEEHSRQREGAQFFDLVNLPANRTEDGAYFYLIATGRQEILLCSSCHYTARRDLAQFIPAASASEAASTLEKVATPDCHTIDALATYLGIDKRKTAKALMFTRQADGEFVFVVIRGDLQLSEAKLHKAVGEVRPATTEEIMAAGAEPGYASPIGLSSGLIVVDNLIPKCVNLVAGANEAGYHFKNSNYGRDYAASLVADLALANNGDSCPKCGEALELVGGELLADESGYYLENVLASVAEVHHDAKGLTWPTAVSPFDVYLLHLPGKEFNTRGRAEELSGKWEKAGISVLLDDREERAGVKFADADLIGCPVRATVGDRGLKDGMVEFKSRTRAEVQLVPIAEAEILIRTLTNPHDE